MELAQRIAIARGDAPAEVLLTNLQLINVLSGEIYPAEIALAGGYIVGVGAGYQAEKTYDLGGRYVAPGLIDAHVHIESSLCTPVEFAKTVLAHGVTSVITDPHEIANVFGLAGIQFMLRAGRNAPINIYVMASSCVPATHMETSGATLQAADLASLLNDPAVLGLAEMMNYPGVVFGDAEVLAKLDTFKGQVMDGHSPALRGQYLNAYRTAGIMSDHECTTPEEAQEKLRAGLVIFIREATNARNLKALLPMITPENSRRICFCTDDRIPADLQDGGSMDDLLRMAIAGGVNPVDALRMMTLNTAEYFRLHEYGAVAPGYRADLITFQDLNHPVIDHVFRAGELVAQGGKLVSETPAENLSMPSSINIRWESVDFRIPAEGTRIRVIGSIDGQLVTEHRIEEARIVDGWAVADTERDLLKMAVIERHHASGKMGRGFIHGFGLKSGALAGTVAHDHHNLVVIGADDASMMTAAHTVAEMGGGLVVVQGEKVLARLPLPIAGLMSDRSLPEVRREMDKLLAAARKLGSTLHDPFMAMSFMALEVIPALKLTDIGLIDVEQFAPVPLFL